MREVRQSNLVIYLMYIPTKLRYKGVLRVISIETINSHPVYVESDKFREQISDKQRLKGAAKYPELFAPSSWSDDELAEHAMMEFHDGGEYVAGMRTRMRELRVIIFELELENQKLREQNDK